MTNNDLLNLRLAARTLIEWKTPVESKEYQRVFIDLVKMHPNASSWGLTPDKHFLKLDDYGTVLWYLSETLNISKEKSKRDEYNLITHKAATKFLEEVAAKQLIDYGISSNTKRVWSGGPTQSKVANRIIKKIANEDQLLEWAYLSLLAILIPLNHQLQKRNITQLLKSPDSQGYELVVKIFPRTTITLELTAKIFQISKISIWLLLGLYLILISISTLRNTNNYNNENFPVKNLTQLSLSVALGAVSSSAGFFTTNGLLEQSSKRFWVKTKTGFGEKFMGEIGAILCNHSNILISILRRNVLDSWTQIILLSIEKASPIMVKELLQLIRDPEIIPILKEQIFRCLCRVNIDGLDISK